jgi:hypothetical protein
VTGTGPRGATLPGPRSKDAIPLSQHVALAGRNAVKADPRWIPEHDVEAGPRGNVGEMHAKGEGQPSASGESSVFGAQKSGAAAQCRRMLTRIGSRRRASAEQIARAQRDDDVPTLRGNDGELAIKGRDSETTFLAIKLPTERLLARSRCARISQAKPVKDRTVPRKHQRRFVEAVRGE